VSVLSEALDVVNGVPGAIGTEVVRSPSTTPARSLWSMIRGALRRTDADASATSIAALEAGRPAAVDELVRLLGLVPAQRLTAPVSGIRATFGRQRRDGEGLLGCRGPGRGRRARPADVAVLVFVERFRVFDAIELDEAGALARCHDVVDWMDFSSLNGRLRCLLGED
jgi:hypothetical protein